MWGSARCPASPRRVRRDPARRLPLRSAWTARVREGWWSFLSWRPLAGVRKDAVEARAQEDARTLLPAPRAGRRNGAPLERRPVPPRSVVRPDQTSRFDTNRAFA